MDQPLTADQFLPHVGQVFRVKGGRHALTLSRVDVHALDERQAKVVPRPPFTVIFAGPPGDLLREGLHVLERDGGPAFELYVMPIQTFALDRQDYQAAFN
jgi:Domain of unknown function (DUF6916)